MTNLDVETGRALFYSANLGLAVAIIVFCHVTSAVAQDQAPTFGSPVACELGRDCFVQHYVDLDPTSAKLDPFCEKSTYDGHNGTDIRVLSMADLAKGVAVLAIADGTVLRVRDGEPDSRVTTPEEEDAVAGKECGNGLVIEHEGGIEAQYCHLLSGSVRVMPGETVAKGHALGMIGASGLAEFPHVHFTVRRAGQVIEPVTGRTEGAACDAGADLSQSLFDPAVARKLAVIGPQRLASGLADGPVNEALLVTKGPPAVPGSDAPAIVGWTWLVNLRQGDRLTVRLLAPDGTLFAENEIPPLDRDKATYVAYAGRKRSPVPGNYTVETEVRRGDAVTLSASNVVRID